MLAGGKAERYERLSDEQLLQMTHTGDKTAQDVLIDRYKNFVKVKTRLYFMIGADKEDIIQEGMIGLYKAIRDFKPDKQSSFGAFAELCVTRQMITAIKAAARQKHIPLNSYVSLNKTVFEDDDEKTYIDTLAADRIYNPEELFIGREGRRTIETRMNAALSALECRVLSLYLQGKTYVQIGEIVSKDEKAIDNALQRVRRKVGRIMARDNAD